jgi:hypothetical protein
MLIGAARIRGAPGRLASVRQFTAEHAPAGRAARYASESGAPAAVLFLDGIEADGNGEVALVFDFVHRAGRPEGGQRIAPGFSPPPLDLKRLRFALLLA